MSHAARAIVASTRGDDWTPEGVKARLEEAGATLFALPSTKLWPASYRTAWPAMVSEAVEAYGWNDIRGRLPAPSPEAIGRMDEAYRWISDLVPDALDRRILHARSLVNPRTGQPVISWRKIGELTHKAPAGILYRHNRALTQLAEKLSSL